MIPKKNSQAKDKITLPNCEDNQVYHNDIDKLAVYIKKIYLLFSELMTESGFHYMWKSSDQFVSHKELN